MNNRPTGDHLAILIDADNISSKHVSSLMAEVVNYGTASVRRIYGDWTSPLMKSWRECLLEHSIVPIQQFGYTTGKNATDGAMIIDAMDLLYTGRFSSFCLVSSDSDFTRLAARIREQGISVYGFGNRHNTHRAFVAACNEFVYFDALVQEEEKDGSPAPPPTPAQPLPPFKQTPAKERPIPPISPRKHSNPIPWTAPTLPFRPAEPPTPAAFHTDPERRKLDKAALRGIRKAIGDSNPYDDNDFVNLAEVGGKLAAISPDLNARNYGFTRLKDFIEASGIVEVKMLTRAPAPPIALARLKCGGGGGGGLGL